MGECDAPSDLVRLQCRVIAPLDRPPANHRPGPSEPGWCRMASKDALLTRLEEGRRLQCLVLVAATYQAYYYERIFCECANSYPLLLFATIKLDDGGPAVRE